MFFDKNRHGISVLIRAILSYTLIKQTVMEQGIQEGESSGEVIFSKNTEFNRFGLISAVLLLVGCTGGLAVGLGGVEHVASLIAIVIPTMITLSLLLAVAPMRYVMISGTVSTTLNILFIAYFLIA